MKRVLWLAYYFPPIGGAGVQRSVKFVRYLRGLGWEPVVVTGPGRVEGHWTPEDTSLSVEIPAGTEIRRAPGPEPDRSRGWRARAERWLRVTMPFERWWVEEAIATARATAGAVDLIYASMSPYESAVAAAQLSRELGLPWVADLRDPWALDEMQVYPSALHRCLELARMRRALASADAIVMNTSEAAAALRAKAPELARRHIVAIPNGFDAGDFAGDPVPRADNAFRIVHAGYLHTEQGLGHRRSARVRSVLGGGVSGVDLLTRSHIHLITALDRLLGAEPALRDILELHLVGVLSDTDRAFAERPYVRLRGYLSHDETVDLVRTADLLFLPMQNLPRGKRATITPGKTYEYIAAGRPILAAVPDGDARDLLAQAGTARICRPDDVDAISASVAAELDRWRSGPVQLRPPGQILARYERRRLTEELVAVFDHVVGERAPDAQAVPASG